MANILLIDDSAHASELFARAVEEHLAHAVRTITLPSQLTDELLDEFPADVAVVDLSFGTTVETGLDALYRLHRASPHTKLMVLTQGDAWVSDLLRDAWELLPLAGAMSKSSSVRAQIEALEKVVRHGEAPLDPILVPMLPAAKSSMRTIEGFARLVQHRGHAKLWAAVLACGPNAEYQDLAAHSGLRLNALRNYRAQLLPELAHHGLHNPPMRDLHLFARRCRPFLAPFVLAKGIEI